MDQFYLWFCGVFVLPPIRVWARLYLVQVLLCNSHTFGRSGPPCARCSVGHLCLLKLVLNRFKFYFPFFLDIVMYDNEFETKEDKIETKDKIKP